MRFKIVLPPIEHPDCTSREVRVRRISQDGLSHPMIIDNVPAEQMELKHYSGDEGDIFILYHREIVPTGGGYEAQESKFTLRSSDQKQFPGVQVISEKELPSAI